MKNTTIFLILKINATKTIWKIPKASVTPSLKILGGITLNYSGENIDFLHKLHVIKD